MAGHAAQATSIRTMLFCKLGSYTGKTTNQSPENHSGKEPPSTRELVEGANLFFNEFEDPVILLVTHRVGEVGNPSWGSERLAQYQLDAKPFLDVNWRMADLDWTREDWRFLARRNASALLTTAEGRAEYEREFKDAPLLLDTKQQTAKQEDGADRYNAERFDLLPERRMCKSHGSVLRIQQLEARQYFNTAGGNVEQSWPATVRSFGCFFCLCSASCRSFAPSLCQVGDFDI